MVLCVLRLKKMLLSFNHTTKNVTAHFTIDVEHCTHIHSTVVLYSRTSYAPV